MCRCINQMGFYAFYVVCSDPNALLNRNQYNNIVVAFAIHEIRKWQFISAIKTNEQIGREDVERNENIAIAIQSSIVNTIPWLRMSVTSSTIKHHINPATSASPSRQREQNDRFPLPSAPSNPTQRIYILYYYCLKCL